MPKAKRVNVCTDCGRLTSGVRNPLNDACGPCRLHRGWKFCVQCERPKIMSQFYANQNCADGYQQVCVNCHLDNTTSRRVRDAYGLTVAEYNALMAQPCAICGAPSQHLDHDHATGRIRSPLCARHNKGIGHFEDSVEELLAAAEYLNYHAKAA